MAVTIKGKSLGVQSFTFREFTDKQALADKVKAVGLNTLEICRIQLDITNPADVEEYFKVMNENGIKTSSFGINYFNCPEEEARLYFEFAKKAEIKVLGVAFVEEMISILEKLSAEYGIKLAVHNHGRHDPFGTIGALKKLFAKCSMNIGLCLDTCWMIDAGENPAEAAEVFKDRLYGVHLKDMILDDKGEAQDVILGTGMLNMPELKIALEGAPIDYYTIEYECNPQDPTDDVINCVENVKKFLL